MRSIELRNAREQPAQDGWPEIDPGTNALALRILTPTWTSLGTRLGSVDAYLDLPDMQDLVQREADQAPGASIAILDERGQRVARSGADRGSGAADDRFRHSALRGPTGFGAAYRR